MLLSDILFDVFMILSLRIVAGSNVDQKHID